MYLCEAGREAQFLRRYAGAGGGARIEATLAGVRRTDTGDIAAVQTDDGRAIAGDFFVD